MNRTRIVLLAIPALLAGCSLAPIFKQPEVATPAAWKELPPAERGTWKQAKPADGESRGQWWKVFNDPVLNGLEEEATTANQNLKAAAARVAQARALLGVAKSEQYPKLNAGFGPSRIQQTGVSFGLPEGQAPGGPYTVWRGLLTASYEVDLFGRIADGVSASRSDLESREALFAAAILTLQADVAQTYFALRQSDEQLQVLRDTVKLREEAVRLLQRRYDLGAIGEFDLVRARTDLSLAQNDLYALERQRAQLEHGLAVLLGKAPASFSLAVAPLTTDLPSIPAGLPSTLLERRPDIAAAQRTMAASNARIGVAKAAFFPVLNITALGGYESYELGDLFKWSSRTWALGPLAGTILSMPLFDGGRNQANLDRSYAVLEESVAQYRQTVLSAFADVEDNLAALRTLSNQAVATRDSVVAATRAFKIADSRYKNGAALYLEVIEAQRTLLLSQLLENRVKGERATSTVAFIRALGGGWDEPEAAPAAVPAK
ncbi:MAG: efflux transporter outer membrane subunit [Burkholderiales bacterium]